MRKDGQVHVEYTLIEEQIKEQKKRQRTMAGKSRYLNPPIEVKEMLTGQSTASSSSITKIQFLFLLTSKVLLLEDLRNFIEISTKGCANV